jgi:hypothetical protein
MGYSHEDWLRDQGGLDGLNLDKIRFGHRQQRRDPLRITFMGQPVDVSGQPTRPPAKKPRKAQDDDPGYARFQGRLW